MPTRRDTPTPERDTLAPEVDPRRSGHPAGALGILHPFPSVLVSLLVAALAALAGGTPQEIATLAVAMFGFQVSIGATNDLADLPHDRSVKPGKPLVAGQVSARQARGVAIVGAAVGLALSASLGFDVLAVGAAGFACGIAYDVWLRTRALAWLAYAAAFPLVLAFAWLGATGTMPPAWPLLLLMAAAIGPALHLSNSLVDVHTDAADSSGGLAGRLGQRRAVTVMAILLAVIYSLAWLVVAWPAGAPSTAPSTGTGTVLGEGSSLPTVGMFAATLLAALGVVLSAGRWQWQRSAGWAVQAIATALLGVSLVASVNA